MSQCHKGSEFERQLCKALSLWWTQDLDEARDDIFWRSSQSGGRATQRMKSGKRTYGSYGDLAAVDPIGEPLLKMFTIELKRGSSYGTPGDLLDFKEKNEKHPWAKCLVQAVRSHRDARSYSWMMICRRDHRQSIVYLRSTVFKQIAQDFRELLFLRYRLMISGEFYDFVGVPLETFMSIVKPKEIIACANTI